MKPNRTKLRCPLNGCSFTSWQAVAVEAHVRDGHRWCETCGRNVSMRGYLGWHKVGHVPHREDLA